MMTTTRKAELFDPKYPGEVDVLSFNFTREIKPGEAISGAPVVTVSVLEGADPTPAAMLLIAAQLDGKRVLQKIGGGLAGVRYLFVCEVTLDSGRKLVLVAVLPVIAVSTA